MKNKLLFTTLLLVVGMCLSAQQRIKIDTFSYSGLMPILKPLMIDSLSLDKKEYSDKVLLKTQVNLNKVRAGNKILKTDTGGLVQLEYAREKAIQLLAFNIDATDYCKAKLEITSTEMFEVYINNKKEKSKETKETEIIKSPNTELSLNLEPGRYEVIIKLLSSYKNFNQSELKAAIIPSDTTSRLQISLNDKRKITINDIIEGKRLTDIKLSASGKYFIASCEEVFEGGKREVYSELRELKTNKQLYKFQSSVRPYWMPGSDRIYYWSKGITNDNFYILDPVSLQESVACKEVKTGNVLVAPNEKWMLVDQKEELPAEKGELKRLLSPSDRSGAFRSRNVLYLYDFDNETFQPLSFGSRNTYALDISSDSKKVLFMTTEEELGRRLLSKTKLYCMNLETSSIDTLADDRGLSHAIFSPDGKQILVAANAESFGKIGQNIKEGQIANIFDGQAFIMDLKTKDILPITKNFNPSISGMEWSAFDNKIYFETVDEDRESVYCYETKSGTFEKLDLKEDIVNKFEISKTSSVAVYRGQSVSNSHRLYSFDTKSKSATMIADPYKDRLSEIALGKVEDWNFTTTDGTVIKGRYYLPADFDSTKKYPLIVYYYGGTTPTERVFESRYPLHVYAALGYVVYTLQPSGTIGFGQEFSARHVNAWGKYTADEIIEGTSKFCSSHPFVQSSKIACIGASYGGFMTQYLLTKTNIFAAAISHAGISALSSYWGEGYWGYSYSEVASAGSYPWNNLQLYVEQSPLFHADKINTPLLLLHGGADTNVPIGESIQMYNALKLLGKNVEFIQVEGENHAISAYKKRIDWNKTIYAWFAKWLKGESEWWSALYQ